MITKLGRKVLDRLEEVSGLLSTAAAPSEPAVAAVIPPPAPQTLLEAELNLGQLSSLVLKLLYLHGSLTGVEISRQLRLPFPVTTEGLEFLKAERCLDALSGEGSGRLGQRYLLTDGGRTRARDAFEECRYVGPAPVSLRDYTRQCRSQGVSQILFSTEQVQAAFGELVLDSQLIEQLGPALCSGHSLLLYGPSGNGKTSIARTVGRLLHELGGDIFVPYAFTVDNQIVTVFDPTLHEIHEDGSPKAAGGSHQDMPEWDLRWRKVRRPVLLAAGELTLDQLELRFHQQSGYYTAPLHVKANGGLFLLDDVGRQLVAPQTLLNRWILPLEERSDVLLLATGKKFMVPVEQLTIFSTNLLPAPWMDAAFLRRVRHKIEVASPSEQQYREIFRRCCEQRQMRYDDAVLSRLLSHCHTTGAEPKSSDPRDLLDVVQSICRFRGQRLQLSEGVVLEAFRQCLGSPQLPH